MKRKCSSKFTFYYNLFTLLLVVTSCDNSVGKDFRDLNKMFLKHTHILVQNYRKFTSYATADTFSESAYSCILRSSSGRKWRIKPCNRNGNLVRHSQWTLLNGWRGVNVRAISWKMCLYCTRILHEICRRLIIILTLGYIHCLKFLFHIKRIYFYTHDFNFDFK